MDEKKLNELLNAALASLTEEQKKKAAACKTAQELVDLLNGAGVELSDELLDAVAGGGGDGNDSPLWQRFQTMVPRYGEGGPVPNISVNARDDLIK